jgi:hypothetical protein
MLQSYYQTINVTAQIPTASEIVELASYDATQDLAVNEYWLPYVGILTIPNMAAVELIEILTPNVYFKQTTNQNLNRHTYETLTIVEQGVGFVPNRAVNDIFLYTYDNISITVRVTYGA